MKYDIVKDKIALMINIFPWLRRIFYKSLNCLILRQQYVFKAIKHLFTDTNKTFSMYDAGGGYLQYSDFVLENYPNSEVFAVDIKDDYLHNYDYYLSKTKKYDRFSYHCADLQTFVPRDKYDLIIAIDILEHIENDQQVLDNFATVLNKKGKLIISTPSTFDKAAAFTEEHVRPGYNLNDLIYKLNKANLNVDSSQYTYGKYGAIYWKLAMKIPLQLLSKYKFSVLLLPFYFILTYPVIRLLMFKDQNYKNEIGNGILIVASLKVNNEN